MDRSLRSDPDEVVRDLVAGSVSPEDAANQLWCVADRHLCWGEDPGEALSRFMTYGLGFEASDPDYEFDLDAYRADVVEFAREVLEAGGIDAYDCRLETGASE